MSRTIDFPGGCDSCGYMAGRDLPDGIECIACGHVRTDPFIAAKRQAQALEKHDAYEAL